MREYKVIFIGGPKHGMWEPAHNNAREVNVLLECPKGGLFADGSPHDHVHIGRYYRNQLNAAGRIIHFFAWERLDRDLAITMFIDYLLSPLDLGPAKEPQVKPPSHGPQTDADGLPRNTDTNP